MCDCEDKAVLVKGDGQHIAEEVLCSKHGYQNSCYLCDPNNFTTERCREHTSKKAIYGDIPFLIILKTGRYPVRSLDFKNGFVKIKYKYKCVTADGEIACFRFACDARLAAKHNGWHYEGKNG